jgi:hypothetical protein
LAKAEAQRATAEASAEAEAAMNIAATCLGEAESEDGRSTFNLPGQSRWRLTRPLLALLACDERVEPPRRLVTA